MEPRFACGMVRTLSVMFSSCVDKTLRAPATLLLFFALAQAGCVRFAPDDEKPPAGKTDAAGDAPLSSNPAWIDDFEDGDDHLLPNDERTGIWFMTDDQSDGGMRNEDTYVKPLSVLRPGGSTKGMPIWGSGFSEWGASLAVWFLDKHPLKTYDASRFKGIAFFARVESGTTPNLRFNISSFGTEDEDGCEDMCHDRYGVPLVLNTSWAEYIIDFSRCEQMGFGKPVDFDPSQLYGLEFATPKNARFAVWIDDIRFY
jgi:endoglucanase